MSSHFRSYASNLRRARFVELIDHYTTQLRYEQARPSLIFNPLSGQPYPESAPQPRKSEEPQND